MYFSHLSNEVTAQVSPEEASIYLKASTWYVQGPGKTIHIREMELVLTIIKYYKSLSWAQQIKHPNYFSTCLCFHFLKIIHNVKERSSYLKPQFS